MPTRNHTSARERSARRPALVMGTLAFAGTVVALQQTLVLPLVADLPRLVDTTADNASWLVTVTILSGAVSIPTISRLADMHGKRRMLMIALWIMIAGSLLCAISSQFPLLLLGRAMQGVGLSVLPVGIAAMRDELPRDRLPLGVALMSATIALGAGLGLPLSGVIVSHHDWHAIFWVTGAGGVLLLLLVWNVLGESPVRTGGSFDLIGALIVTCGLTGLMVAISKGSAWGWTDPLTAATGIGGLALLVVFVSIERRTTDPLIDVRLASRPPVMLVNLASLFSGFAMFANVLVTTQQLQVPDASGYGLGLDILHTGLWMAPSGLVLGAVAPIAARLVRVVGPLAVLQAGAAIMAITYAARVYLSDDLPQVVIGSVLVGAGNALAYAALPILIMRSVPQTQTASANGLNTLLRYVGSSTASAAMAAVITMSVVTINGVTHPTATALEIVLWMSAAISLLVGIAVIPLMRVRSRSGALDVNVTVRP